MQWSTEKNLELLIFCFNHKNQRCLMKMSHTCSDLVTFVGSLHIITHSLGSIYHTNDTAEKKITVALFSLSYMIIFPL